MDPTVLLMQCSTSRGDIEIELHQEWAPAGVSRVLMLLLGSPRIPSYGKSSAKETPALPATYFSSLTAFRVIPNFLAQFGIPEDVVVRNFCRGSQSTIVDDDDLGIPITKGVLSFAGNGVNSRTCQMFIALEDNVGLGKAPWERALGFVTKETFPVVQSFYQGYGDRPDQGKIQESGNEYLRREFPKLDWFKSCKLKPNVFKIRMILGGAENINDKVVEIEVNTTMAPRGAARLHDLLLEKFKFYDEARFFRVVPDFVVQFGINALPKANRSWSVKTIKDDPVLGQNLERTISFATSGKDTRSTQIFFNLKDNQRLDAMGFAPVGQVISGWEYIKLINSEYGQSPSQNEIANQGNAYLARRFPRLSYIKKMYVVPSGKEENVAEKVAEKAKEEDEDVGDVYEDDEDDEEEDENVNDIQKANEMVSPPPATLELPPPTGIAFSFDLLRQYEFLLLLIFLCGLFIVFRRRQVSSSICVHKAHTV